MDYLASGTGEIGTRGGDLECCLVRNHLGFRQQIIVNNRGGFVRLSKRRCVRVSACKRLAFVIFFKISLGIPCGEPAKAVVGTGGSVI